MEATATKVCPECKGEVPGDARKCLHCGSEIQKADVAFRYVFLAVLALAVFAWLYVVAQAQM